MILALYPNLLNVSIGIKKEIRLHDLETYNDNKSQDVFVLDEYELKAINKQMEELGWL